VRSSAAIIHGSHSTSSSDSSDIRSVMASKRLPRVPKDFFRTMADLATSPARALAIGCFDASYASMCSDAQWCALCEHELSHCGVEHDVYGAPKFKKSTGLPAFALRGHDVEEFIGVVRRYGAAAAGVQAMIDAAAQGPMIAAADIDFACGNCAK
jgi:hypothetical protein